MVETGETESEVDIGHILLVLWHRAWLIVLAGVLAAALAFGWATCLAPELYSSSVTVYVNDPGNFYGISIGNLTTARSLVQTYLVLLRNRTTLEMVLERADRADVYTYEQLDEMITASAVNDTEVLSITVTTDDPNEAALLANSIVDILPTRIAEIVDGASMRLVDSAIADYNRVGWSITMYMIVGILVGVVLMCALLIILDLLDDVIRDESSVQQICDIPILARVPNLLAEGSGRYGYRKHQYYGYGYGNEK